jgi:hypothetical protein
LCRKVKKNQEFSTNSSYFWLKNHPFYKALLQKCLDNPTTNLCLAILAAKNLYKLNINFIFNQVKESIDKYIWVCFLEHKSENTMCANNYFQLFWLKKNLGKRIAIEGRFD